MDPRWKQWKSDPFFRSRAITKPIQLSPLQQKARIKRNCMPFYSCVEYITVHTLVVYLIQYIQCISTFTQFCRSIFYIYYIIKYICAPQDITAKHVHRVHAPLPTTSQEGEVDPPMNPCRPSLVRVEAFCHAPCVHMIKKPGLYQITMVTRCVSKIWSSWGHSGTLAFYFSHRTDRCNVGPSRPVSVGFIMFISITVGSRVDIYKWIGWKSTCIHGAKDCTHWSGEIRIVPKSCEFVGHLVSAWHGISRHKLLYPSDMKFRWQVPKNSRFAWSGLKATEGFLHVSSQFSSVFMVVHQNYHGLSLKSVWKRLKLANSRIIFNGE